MSKDKKEVESSKKKETEEKKEDKTSKKEVEENFEKDSDVVPASKFNQAVRKQREIELEKRELEKKLEEKEVVEEEEEDEEVDQSALIDEKLKPVLEQMKKKDAENNKKDRTAFFSRHPEYRDSSEKFHEILDTMDESLNHDSKFSYYEQLEQAHRIVSGDPGNAEVEDKKVEMAGDASSGGDEAQQGGVKEGFTAEDRKQMKEFNVSEDGMKAYKKKIADGSMQIL